MNGLRNRIFLISKVTFSMPVVRGNSVLLMRYCITETFGWSFSGIYPKTEVRDDRVNCNNFVTIL